METTTSTNTHLSEDPPENEGRHLAPPPDFSDLSTRELLQAYRSSSNAAQKAKLLQLIQEKNPHITHLAKVYTLAKSTEVLRVLPSTDTQDNKFVSSLVDVHDDSWNTGLNQWRESNKDLMTDPNICYLLVVTGMVQKNIIRKKYVKFEAKAKGGAFGVNINGELYSSTEDFSLDTRFGLTVSVIRRPFEEQSSLGIRGLLDDKKDFLLDEPSEREMTLFQSIQHIKNN